MAKAAAGRICVLSSPPMWHRFTHLCVILSVGACTGPAPADDVVVEHPEPAATLLPASCPPSSAVVRPVRHWTPWQLERITEELLGEEAPGLVDGVPPADGAWEGLATAQAITPVHVEGWSSLARGLAERLLARGPRAERVEFELTGLAVGAPYELSSEPGTTWWAVEAGANLGVTSVSLPVSLTAPVAGTYKVTVRAVWLVGWEREGSVGPALAWQVGEARSAELGLPVGSGYDAAQLLTWTMALPEGTSTATLDVYRPGNNPGDLSLPYFVVGVDWVDVEGPAEDPFRTDSPARRRWVRCDPAAVGELSCAAEVLDALAPRLWRRPLSEEEREGLLGLVTLGVEDHSFDEGLTLAVRAMLLSPNFLLHVDTVETLAAGGVREADSWELASRLALTLWGNVPDDILVDCAVSSRLTTDLEDPGTCGLAAQIDRMLADPRADAVSQDFARQWLALPALGRATRDPSRYPEYDAELGALMAEESMALVSYASSSPEVPLRTLLDSRTTWADDRVAALYGLPPGPLQRALSDRAGLLGHAAVLTLTSQPTRSSPVRRGQWVLDRLRCDPVAAPPDGIPTLDEELAVSGDLRGLMEAHSSNPGCAYCHDKLDPLGLALEGMDAIGRLRTEYEDGTRVDSAAVLPDGTAVRGQVELADALAADPAVEACVVQHVATWALALPASALPPCELERASRPQLGGETNLFEVLRALASSQVTTHVRAPEAE
jgi:hypothetical protein